jgi:uncharacterized protein YbjT (DUF2867 family)
MSNRALVLGASGSFGGAVAIELLTRDWQVTVLARDPARLTRLGSVGAKLAVVKGDAQDGDALQAAAIGAHVIVHGVNYPYPQ